MADFQARDFLGAEGRFLVHRHQPAFQVRNLRQYDGIAVLGRTPASAIPADSARPLIFDNQANFPATDLRVSEADPVYEIPNPFPFRGTTFIAQSWAEAKAADPDKIRLTARPAVSLQDLRAELAPAAPAADLERILARLPRPLQLTLAATGTDPAELCALAALSCRFSYPPEDPGAQPAPAVVTDQGVSGRGGPGDGLPPTPSGLAYSREGKPLIRDHDLYETVANNPHLPPAYRQVMVLRPGAQGGSEIVGEYGGPGQATHIFEYLRRNSYIPWGHYAANFADDAIRYRIDQLSLADLTGLRHLYYQRTYLRLAAMLDLPLPGPRRGLSAGKLEELRGKVLAAIRRARPEKLAFTATLWGWNFGYDISGSGFRLHASHQQIHQQYALIPPPPAFACGDQVARCCRDFRRRHDKGLFTAYLEALEHNTRIDGRRDAPAALIIHQNEEVVLFVPKAQVAQWELQIMTRQPVGNILEADPACREALDRTILLAQQILARLGATLVTSIEYSKRLDEPEADQHLLYALLPKLPYAMGAFSEAQQRWICGHYPEDFAAACRKAAAELPPGLSNVAPRLKLPTGAKLDRS